jgi:Spy/CpxP family protein refolding chaperone
MKSKFQELRSLDKTEANQQKREQLRQAIRQDRQTLASKHEAMLQQVLTPEQMAQFKTLKQQRREQFQKNHPQGGKGFSN